MNVFDPTMGLEEVAPAEDLPDPQGADTPWADAERPFWNPGTNEGSGYWVR